MRISDWSSDVCSSDLQFPHAVAKQDLRVDHGDVTIECAEHTASLQTEAVLLDQPRNRVEALRMPRHQQQGGIGVAAQQFAMRRQQQLILAFMCTRGEDRKSTRLNSSH